MWPPSSGSSGSRFSSASERLMSAEHPEVRRGSRCCDGLGRAAATIPTGLETSLRPRRSTRRPSERADLLRHEPRDLGRDCHAASPGRVLVRQPPGGSRAVDAVVFVGRDRARARRSSPSRTTMSVSGRAVAIARSRRAMSERSATGAPLTPTIRSPALQAVRRPPGVPGDHVADRPRGVAGPIAEHEERREEHDREDEVRRGPARSRRSASTSAGASTRRCRGASPSSLRPRSAARRACGEIDACRAPARASSSAVARRRSRPAPSARFSALDGAEQPRRPRTAPAEVHVQVATAPAGACPGSSRSRRAGSRRCRTRSRCASSSASAGGKPM